jgi:hypothetical protein
MQLPEVAPERVIVCLGRGEGLLVVVHLKTYERSDPATFIPKVKAIVSHAGPQPIGIGDCIGRQSVLAVGSQVDRGAPTPPARRQMVRQRPVRVFR